MSATVTLVSRRKVSTTVYLEQEQLEGLAELSRLRRVPMAALVRGSIAELLARSGVGPRHAGAPLTLEAGVAGGGPQ